MLNRSVVASAVVVVAFGCSSNSLQPPATTDVGAASIPVQKVAGFRAQTQLPEREAVAAWTLTAADGSGMRLAGVRAKAVIEGPLAFTELHLRFHNPENRVREGTFAITLPPRAAISRFAMAEGNHLKEAEVVPKMLARRAYDDFLHRRIDPALLEQAPGNQFTARVFPIPANGDKDIVLSYSQELANEGYMLPLRGLPRIDSIEVSLAAIGLDGAWRMQTLSEKSWQPDRDFVANVISTAAVGDHNLVAGVFDIVPTFTEAVLNQGASDRPAALTLLVDTSASRALGFTRYLDKLRALVGELAARYDGLALDVIAFDQSTQVIYSGRAKDFGDAQMALLVARGPAGASDLAKAASLAKGRTVVLTDAVVTAGLEGVELGKAFEKADRVDIVLAGGIREERVAQTLARAGKRAGDVFDLDRERLEPIANGLGMPVRIDVPVEVANATWFYPKTIPSARDGKQVMVFARLRTPATKLEVKLGGKRWSAPIAPATPALIARATARVEIDELEATLAATPASETKTAIKLRGQIEKLSVAMRVVSSQTTMLVLDTEQDYATYGIDRKSLADILVVGPKGLEQSKRTFLAFQPPAPYVEPPLPEGEQMTLNEGTPPSPPRSDGHYKMQNSSESPQLARQQAIEQARNAGYLGSSSSVQGGAFAALTASSDVSSGFDDHNVYGSVGAGRSAGGGGATSGRYRGYIRSRVAAVPSVSIGQPVASGSLDKAIIKRYIKRRINEISYCYESELFRKPTIEGTVTTQFLIAAGGKVRSVSATGVDEKVSKCVADVIRTIEFPSVVNSAVQVNYPFTFRIAGSQHASDADVATSTTPVEPPVVESAPLPEPPPPPPPPTPPIGDAPISALDGNLQLVMKAIAKKDLAGARTIATRWRDEQPGDMLAWVGLGEALEASGDRAGAARAYGSIIDLFGARAEYRRFAGERLERTGERKLAIDTYRRAVADRPDQLTGHRLHAYALLRDGDHAGAFAAILKGVDQNRPDDRYAGAPLVFSRDAGMIGAAYIAANPQQGASVIAALTKRSLSLVTTPSTRFMLYWETDANDVDLHVRDAQGNEAFFSQKTMPTGGELFADVTTGFGPECFEINGKLPAGPYELGVHYYAQGPMGYGMGLLQIERFDGRKFTFEDRPYVIMRDDARITLGKVR